MTSKSNSELKKIKSLGLTDELHDQIYGLLYTFDFESDYNYKSELENEIELPEYSDSNYENEKVCPDCPDNTCACDDMFYKLQYQFEDLDLNVQTLIAENVLELSKEISDEKLGEKIINLAAKKSSNSIPINSKIVTKTHDYDMSYSLAEVNRRLALSKIAGRDTSFDDLKIEVENLRKEIIYLKQNQMIYDHRISKIEEKTSLHVSPYDVPCKSKGPEITKNNDDINIQNLDIKNDLFLGMMQIVIAYE